jgi:lipopolysaccharide/colanic/teichoic acid biosynthesis glycosyltransferase
LNDGSATAAREATPRMRFPHLTGLSAQRILELLALRLAPAATGGAITYTHLHSEWQTLLVFTCMLGTVTLLRSPRYPLHLIPFASAVLYVLAPPLGAMLAVLVSASDESLVDHLSAANMLPAVIGAWLVAALGAWIMHRFRVDREVRVAVIGSDEFAAGLEAELRAAGICGYRVIGHIDPRRSTERERDLAIPHLGSLPFLRGAILRYRIELLVMGPLNPAAEVPGEREASLQVGPSRLDVFETVADACLDLPVSVIEAGQFYERLLGHVPLGTTTAAWFQYLLHPDYRGGSPASKRALDLAAGSFAALIAAPIMAMAAIAIKLADGGPILYRQTRLGEGGQPIEVLKLRTMDPDADSDPSPGEDRVTGVGRVLRRLHLNELPQIWQVLKGEMSLVGPRPEIPEVVSSLESRVAHYDRRHLLKPGITGWAQVRCGYSGTPIGEAWKLCHDLYYLKRRSLLFDLLMLLETPSAVFLPDPTSRPDERFIVAYRSSEEFSASVKAS